MSDRDAGRRPKPAGLAEVSPSLDLAWSRFSVEEHFLTGQVPGRGVLLRRPGEVICREAATGALRWSCRVPHDVTWAGPMDELLLAAGPDGVTALTADAGRPVWHWSAPYARFTAFHVAGARLLAVSDNGLVIALDAHAGRAVWSHRAPAAGLGPEVPAGRFASPLLVLGDRLLLQTWSRCQILDVATGALQRELPSGTGHWSHAPIPLGGGRAVAVHDARSLVVWDLASGQPAWTRLSDRPLNLTGEPETPVGGPLGLVTLIARNTGTTLLRLNPATGRSQWLNVFGSRDRLTMSNVNVDDARVYVGGREGLRAHSLADGRLLWKQDHPGPWALARTPTKLIAVGSGAAIDRLELRLPNRTYEVTVTRPPEARPGGGIPLLVLDAATGQLLHRRMLPASAPRAAIDSRAAEAGCGPALTVASGAAAAWRGPDPEIHLLENGVLVAWQGDVWSLTGRLPTPAP